VQAWAVRRPGPITAHGLVRLDRDVPEPGPGQIRVRIACCGVCRTDLHLDAPQALADLAAGRFGGAAALFNGPEARRDMINRPRHHDEFRATFEQLRPGKA
jgi:alcohol dehydrogenase, propanol-preferring